jgi:branched-chain amino acid transport system permease protein
MEWLNTIIQGILLGGIYALFAIGLSLSFGIMRLVNIAHGDLIVLSAYVALVVGQGTGLDPITSLVIVVPAMFALGYAIQRGLLNQTLSGGLLPPLLVTFGISIIIQNGLLEGFGAYTQRLKLGAIETASLQLPGGISIGVYPLMVFGVALLALGSMWGTLIGGVVLGIAQAVGAALSPTWQILAGHLAFLVILIVRPSGLFPRTRD